MNNRNRNRWSAFFAVCLSSLGLPALSQVKTKLSTPLPDQVRYQAWTDSKSASALRVLFLGNSFTFTNQIPLLFASLVTAQNPAAQTKIAEATAPGASLEDLWNEGTALKSMREKGPFDFVVIQEWSGIRTSEDLLTFGRKFEQEIHAKGAKTILFQTWSDQGSADEQDKITAAYEEASRTLNAPVAPVGEAFREARKHLSSVSLFTDDGHHPGQAGAYLAACVFYGRIMGKSPEGLPNKLQLIEPTTGAPYTFIELPEAIARELQRAAWTAVQSSH
jgi:hypothetical protein